jgi:hypothetical protein
LRLARELTLSFSQRIARKFKQGVSSLWTFGLALLLVGLLGYPGRAQDQGTPVAPPLASRAGQVVSFQAPHTVVQRQSADEHEPTS